MRRLGLWRLKKYMPCGHRTQVWSLAPTWNPSTVAPCVCNCCTREVVQIPRAPENQLGIQEMQAQWRPCPKTKGEGSLGKTLTMINGLHICDHVYECVPPTCTPMNRETEWRRVLHLTNMGLFQFGLIWFQKMKQIVLWADESDMSILFISN